MAAKRKHKKNKTDLPTPDEALTEEQPQPAAAETEEPSEAAAAEEQSPESDQALQSAREEASKNWDLYLRTQAEMDNFRKRMQRQQLERVAAAKGEVLLEILPVIDNLERAVEHARESDGDAAGLQQGVEMTLDQFGKALERFGVKMVASVGQPFDPACHEAMSQMESADLPPNSVAQEFQKGYWLGERLLRPAMVVVSKAPATPPEPEAVENQDETGQEEA